MKNGNGKHSTRHSQNERDNQGRFTNEDDSSRGGSNRSQNRQFDSDQNSSDWNQGDHRNQRFSDQDYESNRSSDHSDYDSRSDSNGDRTRSNRNRSNDFSNHEGGSYGNYSSGGYNSGLGSFSGSNYSSAGFGGGNYGVGNYGSGSYGSGSSGIGNVSNYSSGGTRGVDYPSQGNDWSDIQESSRSGRGSNTSHRGKGPKSYKRSDERIQEDINDRLTDDHQIDASEVEVKVESGDVTLTGTVNDRSAKRRAEDIVEQISGVSNVQNNIRVTRGESNATSGAGSEGKTKTNGKH